MLPVLVKLGAAAAAAWGGWKLFGSSTPPLQSLRRITPATGVPIQVVVPVVPTVPKPSVAVVPVPAGNGPKATYTPPDPTAKSLGVPIVISPSGAASFSIQAVKDVQKALNALGFAKPPLAVDGNAGPLTMATIKAFQTFQKLTPSGSVDPNTKKALEDALIDLAATGDVIGKAVNVQTATFENVKNLAATSPISVMTTAQLQHALNLLGSSPALVEDGVAGPKTVAAVKAFQISHGLAADGVPGPKTYTAVAIAINNPTATAVAGEVVEVAVLGESAFGNEQSKK
jgi:peptidoglycan hydrolase-like protein with peptidoglycan-binding domain